jgi:hypothetical protein
VWAHLLSPSRAYQGADLGVCVRRVVPPVGRGVHAKREGEAPPLARVGPTAAQLLPLAARAVRPTGGLPL